MICIRLDLYTAWSGYSSPSPISNTDIAKTIRRKSSAKQCLVREDFMAKQFLTEERLLGQGGDIMSPPWRAARKGTWAVRRVKWIERAESLVLCRQEPLSWNLQILSLALVGLTTWEVLFDSCLLFWSKLNIFVSLLAVLGIESRPSSTWTSTPLLRCLSPTSSQMFWQEHFLYCIFTCIFRPTDPSRLSPI